MQGMYITETFWWDMDDRTRGFTKRVQQKLPAGVFPNNVHAGNYSAVTHYLKAVKELGPARAKASGREVVALMKRMPTEDDAFGQGRIREDGRKIHPSYLFQVKKPDERRHPGDVYTLAGTVPAEQAFRPLSEGGCPMVRS
jgi:branched-chain amino acid transport system substrate-binding protein